MVFVAYFKLVHAIVWAQSRIQFCHPTSDSNIFAQNGGNYDIRRCKFYSMMNMSKTEYVPAYTVSLCPSQSKKKQRCEILLRATIYYYRASVEATNWWRQVRCFRRIFSAVLIYAVDLKVSYIFFSFSTLIFHFATNDGGHTFTLIAVSHLLDSRYTEWKVTAKNFHIAIRPLAGQRWNCV